MELSTKLRSIADRASASESIQTEEATKHALVLPFLQALGYDVFNPAEVVPEFVADIGSKKGEKIDYLVQNAGQPVAMIECKTLGSALKDSHNSQLHRYFPNCDARIAILTNGLEYHFFSDLDAANVMDRLPFLSVRLDDLDDRSVATLARLSKEHFELDGVLHQAKELKYTNEIRAVLRDELRDPSADFVRHFASRIHSGRMTQQVIEEFTPILKHAIERLIKDTVNSRLRGALFPDGEQEPRDEPEPRTSDDLDDDDEIVTTAEELEGFYAVKSCLQGCIDLARVTFRDAKSYFAILLDDNNRKTVCRLHFNRKQKYIGFLNEDRKEDRLPIDGVDGVYAHADRVREAALKLPG